MKVCENLTDMKAIEYLCNVTNKLEKSKIKFDPRSIHDLIFRISQSYFDYDDKTINMISEAFTRVRLVELLCHFLKKLLKQIDMKNETLNLLITALINFSCHNESFAKEINSTKIPKVLIDTCLNEEYLSKIKDKDTNDFIRSCVLVIHNVTRDLGNQIRHRIYDFKRVLLRFIKHNDSDQLGIVSILTLSYIVGDKDCDLLNDGLQTIKTLLNKIKYASDNNSKSGGYGLPELMHGLRCISVNDNMKKRIYDDGGLPILINVLRKSKEKETEPTLGTIENMSFDTYICQKLKDEFEMEAILKLFKHHECPRVKKHCEGLLWNMRHKDEFVHEQLKDSTRVSRDLPFDIFISYAGENKDQISMIHERLTQCNIRAWIDKEQMRGFILETMARGIENSKLFLMGASKAYYSSENCRKEAAYANERRKNIIPVKFELKYKPDGWLGFLIGGNTYYEFSARRSTEEMLASLIKEIKCSLDDNTEIKKEPLRPKERKKNRDQSVKSTTNLQNWTSDDVADWLVKSDMTNLKFKFIKIDGPMLAMMFDSHAKSPEYLNKSLENQFQMDMFDVMKFNNALKALFPT